jgi:hypothetical protein
MSPELEPQGPWSSPWLWVAVVLAFILVAVLLALAA